MRRRATRSRRTLRWGARLAAGALALVLVTAGVVYGFSERRIRQRFDVPEHPLAVPDDAARDSSVVARGKHLATIRGCVDCHGADLAGHVMVEDPALGRTLADVTEPDEVAPEPALAR